ncbi:MAG: Uma2 family endonuclease [Rhodocyclaceae bacterium]|nr:Uma2 family endonuclease [Rhodocyclaceae bacterium]
MTAASQSINFISEAEYLQGEQYAELRHEYIGGAVYAMVGATDRHGLLVMNIAAALHRHLRGGPCQVFASDMKVRLSVADETVFYYPDVLVSCRQDDRERLFRQHPCLLVEVLSEATERTDRREKFLAYQTLASLENYVLVAQDAPLVTVFRRAGGWKAEHLGQGDTLSLPSLEFSIPLAEIYEGV